MWRKPWAASIGLQTAAGGTFLHKHGSTEDQSIAVEQAGEPEGGGVFTYHAFHRLWARSWEWLCILPVKHVLICTGDLISWSTWILTRNLFIWRYSRGYGVLTNRKCDDFALLKPKNPTNFSNGFTDSLRRSWDLPHAGGLVVLDLGAHVPTFLDLTLPVRVLLAHGARGSGSRPRPRPAGLWEFHCIAKGTK